MALVVGTGIGWRLGRTTARQESQFRGMVAERGDRREEARGITSRLYEVDPSLDRAEYLAPTPDSLDREFRGFRSLIDNDMATAARGAVYGRSDVDLATIGDVHESAARALWSSSEAADGFRCGFHYWLAACCQSRLNNRMRAGWLLHFAGHHFRSLRSMEKAARAYVASATEFAEMPPSEESVAAKRKSARRAMALYSEVGEIEKAREVAERFLGA
ncbi:MAG: hypothetical protein R3E12_01805 [Candidatus Eisenbacteria bacterium]